MAQSHTPAFPFGDNDIIVGVSAKDATRGFYGVLPAPAIPAELDPGMATALNVGLYYDAVRSAQSAANKAVKEGKDVPEAINAHLKTFKPDTDRTVNTIAAKRFDIACELAAERVNEKTGSSHTAAGMRANAQMPAFMERNAVAINERLMAWLNAGYEVTKKGKGATADAGVDLSEL